jgi:hypothetical protein
MNTVTHSPAGLVLPVPRVTCPNAAFECMSGLMQVQTVSLPDGPEHPVFELTCDCGAEVRAQYIGYRQP